MTTWAACAVWFASMGQAQVRHPEVPTYPGARAAQIAELAIDGRPHALGYFTTGDPVERVAEWYAERWEHDGFPTFVDGSPDGARVVSAFATREGLILSVVLLRHGAQTLGFGAVKDLRREVRPTSLPAPVKLEGRLVSDVAMDGARQRALVARGGLLAVRDDVGRAFAARGARLSSERGGLDRVVLEHSLGSTMVLTVLTAIDDESTAIHQTWMAQ